MKKNQKAEVPVPLEPKAEEAPSTSSTECGDSFASKVSGKLIDYDYVVVFLIVF